MGSRLEILCFSQNECMVIIDILCLPVSLNPHSLICKKGYFLLCPFSRLERKNKWSVQRPKYFKMSYSLTPVISPFFSGNNRTKILLLQGRMPSDVACQEGLKLLCRCGERGADSFAGAE